MLVEDSTMSVEENTNWKPSAGLIARLRIYLDKLAIKWSISEIMADVLLDMYLPSKKPVTTFTIGEKEAEVIVTMVQGNPRDDNFNLDGFLAELEATGFTIESNVSNEIVAKASPNVLHNLSIELESSYFTLRATGLSSEMDLTLETLTYHVIPFLEALIQLQTIINNIRGSTNPSPILIKKIESNSPITVDIAGVLQAIQVLRDLIVPWRRAHAHQSAELTLKQQEAQIADLEAQTKSKQTEARIQRAEAKKAEASATAAKLQAEADAAKAQAEAQRIHAEAERLKAEATKLHAEAALLQFQEDKGRFELAVQIVDRYGSQLPDQQKLTYIAQLAGPLRVLTTSPLEPILPEPTD